MCASCRAMTRIRADLRATGVERLMNDTDRKRVYRDVLPVHRDLFYDGAWHAPQGGYQDTFDPARGENLGRCAEADARDVEAAAAAADAAFAQWRHVKPLERGAVLRRIAVILRDHA